MAGRFELFTTTVAQISRSIQRIKAREMLRFGLRGRARIGRGGRGSHATHFDQPGHTL